MRPTISELSFGFALTSELIGSDPNFLPAPTFPTQYEEGRVGGYDVRLARRHGRALFLQFKRSWRLEGKAAKEAAQLGLPYYRFYVTAREHSDQHDLMLEFQSEGHSIYYAAPEFIHPAELRSAAVAGEVDEKTAYFTPAAIGKLLDDEEHYVSFPPQDEFGLVCSDPREVTRAVPRRDLPDETAYELGDEYFAPIVASLEEWYGDRTDGELSTAWRAASLARVVLGAEMLLWSPERQKLTS